MLPSIRLLVTQIITAMTKAINPLTPLQVQIIAGQRHRQLSIALVPWLAWSTQIKFALIPAVRLAWRKNIYSMAFKMQTMLQISKIFRESSDLLQCLIRATIKTNWVMSCKIRTLLSNNLCQIMQLTPLLWHWISIGRHLRIVHLLKSLLELRRTVQWPLEISQQWILSKLLMVTIAGRSKMLSCTWRRLRAIRQLNSAAKSSVSAQALIRFI